MFLLQLDESGLLDVAKVFRVQCMYIDTSA